MDSSRTSNSIKNAALAVTGKVFNLIVQFALRTVFIKCLSGDYLGVSGLFTNILTFLSLAELGVGTAITYSLYKPIADQDDEQIMILMRIYKKAYIIIGLTVLAIGFSLTPFLDFFYKDPPKVDNLDIIYMLFVLNSGLSYFFSYKSSFIIANQKSYITTNNTYLFNFLAAVCQAVVLVIYRNYILYLIIQVVFTLLANISISLKADKLYPVLLKKTNQRLDSETKDTIISNIKALVFHKLGGIIVFSTDNILLSKMFGVVVVGYYSNYTLIVNSIEGVVNQAFTSIAASVGNLGATASYEHREEVYNNIFYVNFWIYSFCSICLACLINPFILLWIGNDYIMSNLCCVFIVINFYLKGMRQTNMTFNSAFGLAPRYKYMPIPECIVNIVFSILLGEIIGPAGIFIGTTISTISSPLWIEARVLYKYGLHSNVKKFSIKYFKYALITLIAFLSTYLVCSSIGSNGWSGFIGRIITCIIVPNIIILVMTFKSEEFSFFRKLMKSILHK